MIVLKNKIRTRTTRHFGAWKGSEKALKIFHSKVNKTYAMKVDYNASRGEIIFLTQFNLILEKETVKSEWLLQNRSKQQWKRKRT